MSDSGTGVGRLVLKGGLDLSRRSKKSKKSKKHKKKRKESNDDSTTLDVSANTEPVAAPVRLSGKGKILTSNTTVLGQNTDFMNELSVGDALMVLHPTSLVEEVRMCTMVLSNISISLSSPFSSDLVTATSFSYIKKPKSETQKSQSEGANVGEKRKRGDDIQGSSNVLTYREKTSGGYRIVKKVLDKELTREELLDLRCKKKSDRICM